MEIKLTLSPADYQTIEFRANRCQQSIEQYLGEVVSCAAADLRQQPTFRVTPETAWERKPLVSTDDAPRTETEGVAPAFSRRERRTEKALMLIRAARIM